MITVRMGDVYVTVESLKTVNQAAFRLRARQVPHRFGLQ
jgi:hypothetical protein